MDLSGIERRLAAVESQLRRIDRSTSETIVQSTAANGSSFVFLENGPQELVSYAGGARTPVSWTGLDISGYVPAGATHALVWALAQDQGAGAAEQKIQVSGSSSGSPAWNLVDVDNTTPVSDVAVNAFTICPISSQIIYYQVVDGFDLGWRIDLIGYVTNG